MLLQNHATISADGTAPRDSSPAEVLLTPFGILFEAGSSAPIQGGTVSLLSNPGSGTLLALSPLPGTGALPNLDNSNPFVSDAAGRYSFLLGTGQIGAPGSPATFFLEARRQDFLTRSLQIEVEPSTQSGASTPIYHLTVSALDGLPLSDPNNLAGSR